MKYSSFISILALFILFASCEKDSNSNIIKVNGDTFSSENLSNNLDQVPDLQALSSAGFDHYILLLRQKHFSQQDSCYKEMTYAATSDDPSSISLTVGSTTSSQSDGTLEYSFSNPCWYTFQQGVQTDFLNYSNLANIPFSLSVTSNIYQGNFPDPGNLHNNLTTVNIDNVSISSGQTLNWNVGPNPNGKIKLFIHHLTTFDGSPTQQIKGYLFDDTGTLNVTSSMLSIYSPGDNIVFELSRDIFLQSGALLVRSIEQQSWTETKLSN